MIAYHIARERLEAATAEEAVRLAMKRSKGAYALVVSSPRKMIGARDPFGLKPLCIGKRENTYFLASESCAIAAVDAEFVRDVLPGEIVTITKDGIASDMSMAMPAEKQARCIFEYIYFARTDSTIDGVNVYHSRIIAGKALAESYPVGDRSGSRSSGFGTGSGKGIFRAVRNPLRNGIPQEQLCWKNLHQAEAE